MLKSNPTIFQRPKHTPLFSRNTDRFGKSPFIFNYYSYNRIRIIGNPLHTQSPLSFLQGEGRGCGLRPINPQPITTSGAQARKDTEQRQPVRCPIIFS